MLRTSFIYFYYTFFHEKVLLEGGETNDMSMVIQLEKKAKQEILPGRKKLYVAVNGEIYRVREY